MVKYLVAERLIPAADWIVRLGRETNAFDVDSVVQCTTSNNFGWDFSVTISLREPDRDSVELLVQTKSQLTPSSVNAVVERMRRQSTDKVLLLCCPFVSPRVAEMLQAKRVSYIDQAGNAYLVAPGLFLHISGRPNRGQTRPTGIDLFSKKSSRIVRTLLSQPTNRWQVQQLAKESHVSLGLASKVKQALVEEAYLEEHHRLLQLRDPRKLLEAWSAAYRPHVTPIQIFTIAKTPQNERQIADWCERHETPYALTQFAAAWRYAPMVRYDKTTLYFDKSAAEAGKLTELLHDLNAREVDSGATCTLWLTDDPAVFEGTRTCDGVKVVSPIQLYLDLKSLPGRGEEAAAELYDRELRKLLEPTSMHESSEA